LIAEKYGYVWFDSGDFFGCGLISQTGLDEYLKEDEILIWSLWVTAARRGLSASMALQSIAVTGRIRFSPR